jgi:hypothetical protein
VASLMCPPLRRLTDMIENKDRITRIQVCEESRSWLGTPYHHGARIKGSGVDCAQILYAVYSEALGLVAPMEIEDYPPDWMKHRAEERFLLQIEQHSTEVAMPEPGDVAIWQWGRCFAHAAIVQDWPVVLHADSKLGKVTLADATQGRFAGRAVRFFRVEGVA